MKQLVCFLAVGDPFVYRIPLDSHVHGQGDVRQMCKTGGPVTVLQGAEWLFARFDTIKEVPDQVGSAVFLDIQVTMGFIPL